MTETTAETALPKQIAGFWRRTIALLLDALVLGVPAYFLAQLAFDQLAALGQQGRIIGLAVTLVYFGIGESTLWRGQTIGKRLCAIRVAGASGEPVSLVRALLRTIVFSIPLYLNGLYLPPEFFPNDQMLWLGGAMLFWGVFGFGLASLYLFIFNTGTRQALHDLFLETYVVREENVGVIGRHIWAGHIVVVLAWFIAVLATPIYLRSYVGEAPLKSEPYSELNKIQQAVAKNADFTDVQAKTTFFTIYTVKVQKTTNYLEVAIRLKHRTNDSEAIVRDVARKVLEASPGIIGMDELSISVGSGRRSGGLALQR